MLARLSPFSQARDGQRSRRAGDVLVGVPAVLGLVLLALAYPPGALERRAVAALEAVPAWLSPMWAVLYDTLGLFAVVLLVAVLVGRRGIVALQVLLTLVAVVLGALLLARAATGDWPSLDPLLTDPTFSTMPLLRLALTAGVVLAVAAHLIAPLQRLARWVLILGATGGLLVETASPSAAIAAVLLAAAAAAGVRLLLGSSTGEPDPARVTAALDELGLPVSGLARAARQPGGAFVATAEGPSGEALLVKVHGRDAYDTHLLERFWRAVVYRDAVRRLQLSRVEAAEREALFTFLAEQAGVAVRPVRLVAELGGGDAILVLGAGGRRLADLPSDEVDDAVLDQAWAALAALHGGRIAHGRIDASSLLVTDGHVGFDDLAGAWRSRRPDELVADRVQLLATTALLAGPDRAVAAARRAMPGDEAVALLPFLQPAVLGWNLRRALRDARVDLGGLRDAFAEAAGGEVPKLVELRRLTVGGVIQTGLLVFAVAALIGAISGVDYDAVLTVVEDAAPALLVAAFVVAQLARVAQTLTTLSSVPMRLPFGPTYLMQLATGYLNFALPSGMARAAVSIRFFQRQGVPAPVAVTAGVLDTLATALVQVTILVSLLLFSAAEVPLAFELPSGPPTRALLVIAGLALVAVAVGLAVGRVRRGIASRLRHWWPGVRDTVGGLQDRRRTGGIVAGSLAAELLFATTLALFATAVGGDVTLVECLVINISVTLLATVLPVPGGVGIAEFGLTAGLVASGMSEEAALTAALLHRAATFYLPPLWGFFAMRWLRANDLL